MVLEELCQEQWLTFSFIIKYIFSNKLCSFLQAMKNISQESFEQAMQGIVSDTNAALRDEAPQAYKVNMIYC